MYLVEQNYPPSGAIAELQRDATNVLSAWKRVGLLLLSTLLLSLAFAPVGQFYLAWIGLVPWLLVVRDARSHRSAFLWSWLGGTLFFIANMWWLAKVTVPGMIALLAYLGAFFGYVSLILRTCRVIDHRVRDDSIRVARFSGPIAMLLFAAVWVALEYIRGNWSMFGNQGLPWLNLGTNQTPFLNMCQIADFGGGYAVSFWVCIANFLVFDLIRAYSSTRLGRKELRHSLLTGAMILGCSSVYGAWRMSQFNHLKPGPTVVVIQPNYKQDNSGAKGAKLEEIIDFHIKTTRDALAECAVKGQTVDLVAWSETMMPPLNDSARSEFGSVSFGETIRSAYDGIAGLSLDFKTSIVVGGMTYDDWQPQGDSIAPIDRRNSAFLFSRGVMSSDRYDKIHLVPFGEFIPFQSVSWIHAILLKLGPSGYENYVLTPGNSGVPAVFSVNDEAGPSGKFRFATPICFEDLVSDLVARMVREKDGGKRVDLLVNLTNDGWFLANEMPQHFQAAIFRSIENRVPTARTVNTGISGFIDSMGRVHNTVAADKSGWNVSSVMVDDRLTIYTRYGDWFVLTLLAIAVALIVYSYAIRFRDV